MSENICKLYYVKCLKCKKRLQDLEHECVKKCSKCKKLIKGDNKDITTNETHKCKTKDCKKICPVCNEEYDVRCVTLHKRKKSHIKALNKEVTQEDDYVSKIETETDSESDINEQE